ncbi:hypothetical protein F511_27279 [Dorcoceras hygrometricum]|uniref:Uncharacterized protein n=1 Tax=Dorcoceras hygrometricum TaxID=472368 RepID=A0A2Z7CH10_9LAMI|nr:hypothetical protein F511_27279 [Dorcoceras hygrometricum]
MAAPLPACMSARGSALIARWPRKLRGRWGLLRALVARRRPRRGRPLLMISGAIVAQISSGHTRAQLCARPRYVAPDGRSMAGCIAQDVAHWLAIVGRPLAAWWPRKTLRCWPIVAAGCALVCAACMVAAAAAVRPPSGDDLRQIIATAEFFLLGYVRACPGQPVKFSGRYSISNRFWSILKF